MKIAHISLASFFTNSMTYQDNYLTEQNVKDGHEVFGVVPCKCSRKFPKNLLN